MSTDTDSASADQSAGREPISICVFCGAKTGDDAHWMDLAERIGQSLAQRGIRVIYGGGGVGLMGALAGGALSAGGEVVGVIPHSLMNQELGKLEVTRLERVDSMAERKTRMLSLSDAFVILPGGLGTLDELFEVMTLRQIGLHKKPVGVLNQLGYFDAMRDMLSGFVQAGFVRTQDCDYLHIETEIDTLLDGLMAELGR